MIPVDLFGQPADYDAIEPICAARGHVGRCPMRRRASAPAIEGRKVGTIGLATTTSFFPAKPLGCYGDGGAIFTDDAELADIMTLACASTGKGIGQIRQCAHRHERPARHVAGGGPDREAQDLLRRRSRRATASPRATTSLLAEVAIVPRRSSMGATSVWAQYTLRLPGFDRERLPGRR